MTVWSPRPDDALAVCSQGTIERLERRVGIIPIGWVQRILRVVLIGGIERIVGVVPIRWIHRITGVEAVRRVEGIFGRIGLCGVQRVVRRIPIRGVEDVVIALVFLVEARIGKCRRDREEQRQQKEEGGLGGTTIGRLPGRWSAPRYGDRESAGHAPARHPQALLPLRHVRGIEALAHEVKGLSVSIKQLKADAALPVPTPRQRRLAKLLPFVRRPA